ncbi:MAG: putative quinol monooxygenase [Geminicoccaceae bacterium]
MHRVVIVEFRAKSDQIDAFAALIDRHAHNSRTLEDGCLVFDVCQDPDEPARFVLYEVYRDGDAHAQHREMDSFKRFFGESPKLLVPGPGGDLFHSRRVLERRAYSSE